MFCVAFPFETKILSKDFKQSSFRIGGKIEGFSTKYA